MASCILLLQSSGKAGKAALEATGVGASQFAMFCLAGYAGTSIMAVYVVFSFLAYYKNHTKKVTLALAFVVSMINSNLPRWWLSGLSANRQRPCKSQMISQVAPLKNTMQFHVIYLSL